MQDGVAGTGERLSALLDGEVEAADAAAACRRWQDDADCRRDWHAWHVIGDVLRSDELARGASGDARFVAALRIRLAGEPVVLAPAPLPDEAFVTRRRRSSRRWALPAAAAAGVVLVAGTFLVIRPGGPGAVPAVELAAAGRGATVERVAEAPADAKAAPSANDIRLIRDARLDRYLAAHKQFAGKTAPGWPAATLRNAAAEVEGR